MYGSAVYFAAFSQVGPGPFVMRGGLVWLPCVGKLLFISSCARNPLYPVTILLDRANVTSSPHTNASVVLLVSLRSPGARDDTMIKRTYAAAGNP